MPASSGSIWDLTLGALRERLATGGPTPGGVAVASVAASLGMGLLAMVLEVASARTDFHDDREKLDELRTAARREAIRIGEYADEDVAAFEQYLAAMRLPRGDDRERAGRRNAMRDALRAAIEVPLAAARAAAGALELCADAVPFANRFVAPDLGTAAAMLHNAVRSILLSVDYNAGQLSFDPDLQAEIVAQRRELESQASARADQIIAAIGVDDWWQPG